METYTFSRALHLMRINRAKMRCLEWTKEYSYICIEQDCLIGYFTLGKRYDLSNLQLGEDVIGEAFLSVHHIMSSWVEVK